MQRFNEKIILVSSNTGEYLGELDSPEIYQKDERSTIKRNFRLKEKKDILQYCRTKKYQELGSFVWNIYKISEPHSKNIKPSSLTRLMYLSTYLSYDSYLTKPNNIAMNRNDIFETLKISKREFETFISEMKQNGIIFQSDNKWYIDKKIFYKGRISRKELSVYSEEGKYFIRLYCEGIRKLYRSATVRSHKTLSNIFQMIPYINRKYNILCCNPLETDINKVQPMRLGEFCDIVGYNSKNAARLFNTLFEPTFILPDGSIKSAVRYVADKSTQKKTYKIFINPRIYYAGDNWEQVEVLGGF